MPMLIDTGGNTGSQAATVMVRALAVQVVSATIIGALLPLGASALKLDPALVASPALTTVVDITGLLIYFGTVSLILGI